MRGRSGDRGCVAALGLGATGGGALDPACQRSIRLSTDEIDTRRSRLASMQTALRMRRKIDCSVKSSFTSTILKYRDSKMRTY